MIVIICISCGKKTIIELHGNTMGTTYNIKISGDDHFENIQFLQNSIDSVLIHVNEIFSTYIPYSEISMFNKSDSLFKITDEFKTLLLKSMEINGSTNISVGQTINVKIPVTGTEHDGKYDKYYTGKGMTYRFYLDEIHKEALDKLIDQYWHENKFVTYRKMGEKKSCKY